MSALIYFRTKLDRFHYTKCYRDKFVNRKLIFRIDLFYSLENSNGTLCPGNHIDFPNCTKCATNYEDQAGKCLILKSKLLLI